MYQYDDVALNVSGVTKRFVKSDGFRWPWKKRNGNGRKPVVAVDAVEFQVQRGEVFGSFTRSFTLQRTVDGQNIVATFDNGVLTVKLPKVAEAKGRKIEIQK